MWLMKLIALTCLGALSALASPITLPAGGIVSGEFLSIDAGYTHVLSINGVPVLNTATQSTGATFSVPVSGTVELSLFVQDTGARFSSIDDSDHFLFSGDAFDPGGLLAMLEDLQPSAYWPGEPDYNDVVVRLWAETTPTPEPATALLAGVGLLLTMILRKVRTERDRG